MIGGIAPVSSPAQPTAGEGRQAQRRRQPGELSPDQQRMVAELQARDREVRAHESAHKAVGGSLASGISYTYQVGPDGRRYAVGGEVGIDTGAERDPEATIAKMRQVIAAALAPAQPSAQDRAVAAQARATMAAAQRELAAEQRTSAYGAAPAETGQTIDVMA